MNTTGCPVAFATDEMFQYNTRTSCETPLAGYYVYTLFIVALKFFTAGRIFLNWLHKRRRTTADRTNRLMQSMPLIPFNYLLFALVNLAVAVLGGLNIVNFRNGWALAIYSVAYFPFAWGYSYGLIKLVKLGDKIIPKAHRQLVVSTDLATFDRLGKVLLTFAGISFISSSCVLIVLGPIIPEKEQIFLQIGFGFKAGYAAASIAGYVYHFERCVRVIRNVESAVKDFAPGGGRGDLDAVIRKMRVTQALHLAVGFPSVLLLALLAAAVIPANVWIVLLPPALEAVGNVFYSFGLRGRRAKQNKDGDNILVPAGSGNNSRSSKVASPANETFVSGALSVGIDDNK